MVISYVGGALARLLLAEYVNAMSQPHEHAALPCVFPLKLPVDCFFYVLGAVVPTGNVKGKP